MKIKTLKRDKLFTPRFNNNMKLNLDERVTIEIKEFPTVTTISNYKSYRFKGGATELIYSDYDLIISSVGKICNLEDDNGRITDGIALASSSNLNLRALITEIRDYLLNEAQELLQKEESDSV